jgi:ATP-dependent exoDNAse (exonuclease V) beta subunit
VEVRSLLSLEPGGAERGTLVHAWLEQLRWIEEGLPEPAKLRAIARRLGSRVGEAEMGGLIRDLGGWLAHPAIRAALSQTSYPAGALVEREVPFLHREGEVLLDGKIDRLVRFTASDGLPSVEILDYKTDACAPGDGAALALKREHYRPQMDAYARAIAAGLGLPRERVRARLVMLAAGEVVQI